MFLMSRAKRIIPEYLLCEEVAQDKNVYLLLIAALQITLKLKAHLNT